MSEKPEDRIISDTSCERFGRTYGLIRYADGSKESYMIEGGNRFTVGRTKDESTEAHSLSQNASMLLALLPGWPFNGAMQVYPGENEDENQKAICRVARELVAAGLATMEDRNGDQGRVATLRLITEGAI